MTRNGDKFADLAASLATAHPTTTTRIEYTKADMAGAFPLVCGPLREQAHVDNE
jgi:hypothetical protein